MIAATIDVKPAAEPAVLVHGPYPQLNARAGAAGISEHRTQVRAVLQTSAILLRR